MGGVPTCCVGGVPACCAGRVLDWEEKLEDLAESIEKERWDEGVWELWKAKVIKGAERGIGKKKVNEHSKGWWSTEVEMVIQARKEACRKLKETRRTVNKMRL